MKIAHIGLAAHYTETMKYQDEMLADVNSRDGHSVYYISDTKEYVDGKLYEVGPTRKLLKNGVCLIRVQYDRVFTRTMSEKALKCHLIYDYLKEIKPDVILYHGLGGYSLLYVVDYIKEYPNTLFFADCHATFDNSSRNILSYAFNKYVNGLFIRVSLPYINKVLYVAEDSKIYLRKMYNINDDLLEWFPLGGFMLSKADKRKLRNQVTTELRIPPNAVIYAHSGKLNHNKKTLELLASFAKNNRKEDRMLVVGSIDEEIRHKFNKIISEDSRILVLGWKTGDDLIKYLAAADVYCQPGTVSATLQNALCCGCVIMSYPWLTYSGYDNGNIIWVKSRDNIEQYFENPISKEQVDNMASKSFEFAEKYLDYRKIAARLYHG